MKVKLVNSQNVFKIVPTGFSWTMLFFGFFVPLLRGDWKGLLFYLLVSTVCWSLFFLVIPPFLILIAPFLYNKWYIRNLLEKGYAPMDETDRAVLIARGIIIGRYQAQAPSQDAQAPTLAPGIQNEKA